MWSTSNSTTSTLRLVHDPWPYILYQNFYRDIGKSVEYFRPLDGKTFDDEWANGVLQGNIFESQPSRNRMVECSADCDEDDQNIDRWIEEMQSNKILSLEEQISRLREAKHLRAISGLKFSKLKKPMFTSPVKDNTLKSNFSKTTTKLNCDQKFESGYILKKIQEGCRIFLIDVCDKTQDLCKQIKESFSVAKKLAKLESYEVVFGAIVRDGRNIKTGRILHDVEAVYLDRGSVIVLTSSRSHCRNCCHQIIYANIKDHISKLGANQLIKIGPMIKLRVSNTSDGVQVLCAVVQGGLLVNHMDVHIPDRSLVCGLNFTAEQRDDVKLALEVLKSAAVILPHKQDALIEYIRKQELDVFILGQISEDKSDYSEDWLKVFNGFLIRGLAKNISASFLNQCIQMRKLLILEENVPMPSIGGSVVCSSALWKGMQADLYKYGCQYTIVVLKFSIGTSEKLSSSTLNLILKLRFHTKIIAILQNRRLAKQLVLYAGIYPCVLAQNKLDQNSTWHDELTSYLNGGVEYARSIGLHTNGGDGNKPFMFLFPSEQSMISCDVWRVLTVK